MTLKTFYPSSANKVSVIRNRQTLWAVFLCALLSLSFSASAYSQVVVRLKMKKSNFMVNEPVIATISITNHAGRELVLRGEGRKPWLNFLLTSSGRNIPLARIVNYRPLVIGSGQTVSRDVSISSSYSLGYVGNFTCTASVSMPGSSGLGFTSNRAHFTISRGRVLWVQRAGVPDAPREIREYKLLSFSASQTMTLYAQVSSANTGANIRTLPLGKMLSFRKPTATLDGKNNMHVLYQVKPNLFTHVCISATGAVISSSQHRRGASGDPRLMTFGDGKVVVAGGLKYDAAAETKKRNLIHSVTDRPAGVYRR